MNTNSKKLFIFSTIIGIITLLSVLDASAKGKNSKGPTPTGDSDQEFIHTISSEGIDPNDPIEKRYRRLSDQSGIQFLNISITRCGHLSDAEYKACQEKVLDGLEQGKSPAHIIPELEKSIENHTLLQKPMTQKPQRKLASHIKPKHDHSKKVAKKRKSKRTIAYNH